MKTTTENTPVWQIASEEKNKVKALLMMLKNYPLDPTFINYGDYCQKIEARSYHPDYRKKYEKKEKQGFYKFSGNFFSVSFAFDIETNDKKTIKVIKEAIKANKETPEFKEAFLDRFNAITFKKTIYLNAEEMKKLWRGFSEWWLTTQIGEEIGIDQIDKAPAILEKLKKEELKNPIKVADKNPKFEIEFTERHYLPEEWNEILELFDKHKTVARQFLRIRQIPKDREKEFKKHTFKATGRSILMNFSKYHMTYKEL